MEQHSKAANYPIGIIKEVFINEMGEVTGVEVFKGKTREVVKRHVTSLIPLLKSNENNIVKENDKEPSEVMNKKLLPKRMAAKKSREKTKLILREE